VSCYNISAQARVIRFRCPVPPARLGGDPRFSTCDALALYNAAMIALMTSASMQLTEPSSDM
jgi:hypothetical protein